MNYVSILSFFVSPEGTFLLLTPKCTTVFIHFMVLTRLCAECLLLLLKMVTCVDAMQSVCVN